MNNKSDGLLSVKITAYALIIMAGIATVLVELSVAEIIQIPASVSEYVFLILVYVCGGIALVLTVGSLLIRRMIHQVDQNHYPPVLMFWAKQLKHQLSGTAAVFIAPLAMCEFIIVMGFVLFILSGNERIYFYVSVIWSLPLFLNNFPTDEDAQRLTAIDEQIEKT